MAKLTEKTKDVFQNQNTDIVTEYTGPTSYLEEDISVPEELVQNKSLVRMEMNIVQFPIFSKNTKRKKNEITTYYFNKNKDTYITVKPSSGSHIPGEAEERIFIGLMKIMKDKGMPQDFIVTPQELKEAAKLTSKSYAREIKKSLTRLSETSYIFKNTLYSNEKRKIIKVETNTNILTYRLIELDISTNKSYRNIYEDKRIKEVYEISLSNPFYQNIIRRGYLTYDSDILLNISSGVARTLYMMLEKIRYNELYVKESVYVLIKKIPLKYDKKNVSMTIKTLENALIELKNKNLIKKYNFIKESTWVKSDVEIFFDESHNTLKNKRFLQDNDEVHDIYKSLQISHTEKNIQEPIPMIVPTQEMILELLNLLPSAAKKLKSIEKTLKNSLEKYGYEKVKKATLYMKQKKEIKNPKAFFIKTLENEWAIDVDLKENIQVKNINKIQNYEFIEAEIKDNFEKEEKYFESLTVEEKKGIENEAYEYYIKKCGANGKIQNLSFNAGKKAIIKEYIRYKNETSGVKIEEKIEFKQQEDNYVITDLNKFNSIIEESLNMYKVILQLSETQIYELKKEILVNLGVKFITKKLTIKDINLEISNRLK